MGNRVVSLIAGCVLFFGLLAIGCSQPASQSDKQTPAATALSQPGPTGSAVPGELLVQGELSQSHESNAVTVEAEPKGKLMAGSNELSFNVTMNTHSVNLDAYDLQTLATVRDGLGQEFRATSWQAPKGGHHVSGVLTFTADKPLVQWDSRYIEMSIDGIANAAHSFRWELRPAS